MASTDTTIEQARVIAKLDPITALTALAGVANTAESSGDKVTEAKADQAITGILASQPNTQFKNGRELRKEFRKQLKLNGIELGDRVALTVLLTVVHPGTRDSTIAERMAVDLMDRKMLGPEKGKQVLKAAYNTRAKA